MPLLPICARLPRRCCVVWCPVSSVSPRVTTRKATSRCWAPQTPWTPRPLTPHSSLTVLSLRVHVCAPLALLCSVLSLRVHACAPLTRLCSKPSGVLPIRLLFGVRSLPTPSTAGSRPNRVCWLGVWRCSNESRSEYACCSSTSLSLPLSPPPRPSLVLCLVIYVDLSALSLSPLFPSYRLFQLPSCVTS